jgi:uncharacterized membrane protein
VFFEEASMGSMFARHLPLVTLPAALGAATMAGLLFAFSNFVMRALSQLSPACGMEAMQGINVTIVNPVFLIVFVGTPVLYLVVGLGALQPEVSAGRSYLLAGAVCYLAGVLGVTMLVNVPLNNALAELGPSAAPQHWPEYVTVWTRWNHVRTVFAFISAAVTMLGAIARASTPHF